MSGKMYKYLFGPIPSRRLGISLGLDLVPKKVCSIDCVYCEVGKTTQLEIQRDAYIKLEDIKAELTHYLNNNPAPDYVTITASGEPTLNVHLKEILQFIKAYESGIPVALITNGTLLYDKEVREAVMLADLVLPSLDAATEKVFRKINRPHKELDFQKYIQGLIDFSHQFNGKIWLEVFILPDYNDSREELIEMKKLIQKIQPTSVQLNTLDRPGTVPNLKGATREQLQEIVDFWQMDHVEIIAAVKPKEDQQSYRKDTNTAILETVVRRPCTQEDLATMLGLPICKINEHVNILEQEGKIESLKQERGVFYQIKGR